MGNAEEEEGGGGGEEEDEEKEEKEEEEEEEKKKKKKIRIVWHSLSCIYYMAHDALLMLDDTHGFAHIVWHNFMSHILR